MKSTLRFLVVPLALAASPLLAQGANETAYSKQAMTGQNGQADLQNAVKRLAQRPNDPDALADAGAASLLLDDPHAALNFFTRANVARPNDARIVAGLASATVRTENPFEALRLFDDALKLGVSERSIAADRALAFDLLGNFSRAQQDYQLARMGGVTDDLIIHQAVSMSLLGKSDEADGMLVPLLKRDVPEAWRARAFMLAARGDYREADKVAQGFLDADAAERMDRYFRLLPDLTPAQKSAAIHLGHFPASYDIGHDSDAVRQLAAAIPPTTPAQGDARLIPSGAPLGPKATNDKGKKPDKKQAKKADTKPVETVQASTKKAKEEKKVATLSPDPTRTAAAAPKPVQPKTNPLLPPPDSRSARLSDLPTEAPSQPAVKPVNTGAAMQSVPFEPRPESPSQQSSVPVEPMTKVAEAAPTDINPQPAPAQNIGDPDGDGAMQGPLPDGSTIIGSVPIMTAAVDTAATANPAVTPPAATQFDLDAVVKSIEVPKSDTQPSVVPVDLSTIKPAKIPPAEKVSKPIAKSAAVIGNPARIWVQVATGAESALTYDYRTMSRKNAALFDGQGGWTSPWGKSTRLLVGPFDSMADARKWEVDFRKTGGKGFVWQSAQGVEVTPLGGSANVKQTSKPIAKTTSKTPAKTAAKPTTKPVAGKTSSKQSTTKKGGATKTGIKAAAAKSGSTKANTTKPTAKSGAKTTTKQTTAKTGSKSTAKPTTKNTAKTTSKKK